MYNLTDFSLKELRHLSRNMDVDILQHQDAINHISKFEDGEFKSKMLSIHREKLEICREMNVRFLTAIDMVKQKETTHAN